MISFLNHDNLIVEIPYTNLEENLVTSAVFPFIAYRSNIIRMKAAELPRGSNNYIN